MRTFYTTLFLVTIILSCETKTDNELATNSVKTLSFDSALAAELGADNYGMRQYVMAFLKAGPIRDQDSVTAANIQRAHLDNITRMAEEGKLVFAGPFMDDFEIRGIYVFAVETLAEAEELTLTDPAVKSGRLIMELHPFYGSAALMKVNEMHKRISKQPI